MVLSLRRRSLTRLFYIVVLGLTVRYLFFSSSSSSSPSASADQEIRSHGVFERVTGLDRSLNVQKHKFLQARIGRDERDDLFGDVVRNGMNDFWERYQKP
jgi:hypothetical protein